MRYFIVSLILFLLTVPGQAGPFGHMRDSQVQGQVMEKLQEALALSDAQRTQIEPIVSHILSEFKGLRSLEGEEKRTKAMALLQGALGQIRPILNEGQRKQVVEFLDSLKHPLQ